MTACRTAHAPLQVRLGLSRWCDSSGGTALMGRSPAGAGALLRNRHQPADRRASTRYPVTAVVAQPRAEDRPDVRAPVAGGALYVARWTIRPRLMANPRRRQRRESGASAIGNLQVLVDPDRLRSQQPHARHGVTAAREGTAVAAGGYLETPQQRLAIAHFLRSSTPADLRQIIVRPRVAGGGAPGTPGNALRIGDLAEGRGRLPTTHRGCGDQPRRRLDADRGEAAER